MIRHLAQLLALAWFLSASAALAQTGSPPQPAPLSTVVYQLYTERTKVGTPPVESTHATLYLAEDMWFDATGTTDLDATRLVLMRARQDLRRRIALVEALAVEHLGGPLP